MGMRFATEGTCRKTVYIKVDGRRVPLLILTPEHPAPDAPGVLWIHGGGYATGMKEMAYIGRGVDLVREHGAVVVAPGYHLSVLYPYPTALKECYGALRFMLHHAEDLGINKNQLMIGGESAGGGLTAALAMLARDKGEVNVAFQMPLYPMLANFDTDSSRDNHAKIWNTRRNHMAWDLYLRGGFGKKVSPYASPLRQTDYSSLPPAYSFVCTAEPFHDETLMFIRNLQDAGIETKLDVYRGMYHAFDMMEPEHPTSQEAMERFNAYFSYAKMRYFAENNKETL
ncbi:MAG: alpha/beta hydrolase [Lachnospiraceae bacterium]|nr:alpha/beta hydrolase [Lachnospiraceae bacterium]